MEEKQKKNKQNIVRTPSYTFKTGPDYICSVFNNYRGVNSEMEASFTEIFDGPDLRSPSSESKEWCSLRGGIGWSTLLEVKNAGSDGTCRVREKVLSISTTLDMVGLSATFFWTHSNAMWMLLKMSFNEFDLCNNMGSIIFDSVSFRQLLHA